MKSPIRKQVHHYSAVFIPEKTGGYSVTIPALPGCISEGDTFEQALKNIKEATELYLEDITDVADHTEAREIIAPITVEI